MRQCKGVSRGTGGGHRTGVVLLLLLSRSQHLKQNISIPLAYGPHNVAIDTDQKILLQVACYLRGLLHHSNSPKIRGRCPDLCGKVKGVGAHSLSAVGRKFWNLHGN